jgi:adenine deaminase
MMGKINKCLTRFPSIPAGVGALIGLSFWLASSPVLRNAPQEQIADMVLFNGKIVTVDAKDTIAQAVAVKDGKVLQVGSDQQVKALAGPLSKMIDLRGKTVTPGLIDSHYHT